MPHKESNNQNPTNTTFPSHSFSESKQSKSRENPGKKKTLVSHTSHRERFAPARACRREAPRPDRLARDKPTNTPHGACQLGERGSLCRAWPSNEGSPALSAVCSRTTRHARCAPVRRATATVARLTPCDSVACAIVSIRARSPPSENRVAIFFSTARPAQLPMHLRPGVLSPDPLR